MNAEWQNINVSQEKNFSRLSLAEIKSLSEKHPYSFFHQFVYSVKLKETGDDSTYKKQASRTALYSNNLPWLDFLLAGKIEQVQTDEISEAGELTDLMEPLEEERVTEELTIEMETGERTGHEQVLENNSLVSAILDREKEIAEQETELKFEPLHTVDYFASQGIKNITEPMPDDKLGKQLRSFTEWLKIMKKLPAEETVEITESDEKKIKAEAEDSNEAKEVITEAMADVLLKQGKTHKAIEIYQKLSLQHPEKSPYFAALIEQLKR